MEQNNAFRKFINSYYILFVYFENKKLQILERLKLAKKFSEI